jgi:hypothetical protein
VGGENWSRLSTDCATRSPALSMRREEGIFRVRIA